jgi:hypothetical protein
LNQQNITDYASLLDWLEHKMLTSEPRAPISSACVAFFIELVNDLKRDEASHAVLQARMLRTMNANSGTMMASAKMLGFLEACMDHVEDDMDNMDVHFLFKQPAAFIQLASEQLGLGLTVEWCEDETFKFTGCFNHRPEIVSIDVHYVPFWLALGDTARANDSRLFEEVNKDDKKKAN